MEMVKQRQKRLARERQRNLKKRRKVIDAETRVEVEPTNIIETTLNNDSIPSVETEVSIIRDAIQTDPTIEVSLLIHGDRTKDSQRYNIPMASEVAAIMIGDGHE
ncbi:24548_t:CDS:2, partial [Gigaspora rosea]